MTLHEQLVQAFQQCDNAGRSLHGCYAEAAKEVFAKWTRDQAAKRSAAIQAKVDKNTSLNSGWSSR